MQIDLSDQSVLVTGASRGIGVAIARRLAEAGAKVGVHYGASAAEAEALAAEIGGVALRADLSQIGEPERLWAEAKAVLGPIKVLVNNAGIALGSPLDGDAWTQNWDLTQAVNLRAPAALIRAALPDFTAQGCGRIVNIASRAAFRGDTPDYLAYAASKGGLVALTRSIARGFGKQGVMAFTVAPGFTRTEMAQDFIDQYGEAYASSDIALTRMTEPADIAPTVVFLASGLMDHATGSTIDINAGSYVH